MRRSGVRFISPAPMKTRKIRYLIHSGFFLNTTWLAPQTFERPQTFRECQLEINNDILIRLRLCWRFQKSG